MGIITVFAVFGTVQSAALVARTARWSRPKLTVVRVIALTFSLGRFSAAGALMLATVAFASLATWRSDWHQWLRLLLAMAAVPLIVYVANDIGHDKVWNPMTVARIALSSSSTPQSSLPRGQPSRRSPTDGGPGEFYAPSVSAFLDFS